MNEYFSVMMSLAKEAGQIALKLIEDSDSELKADTSVITKADRTISALAHQRLSSYLKTGQHVLVDEEDHRRGEYLDQGFLEKTPFLWSLDPIDATRAYANRMSHYGISIGLLKDRCPWLGVVYFPSLKELFYCDGDEAYFVQNAFSLEEVKTKIVPVDEQITSRSVFIASDELLTRFAWRSTDCHIMIFASAVCEFCWPAIGRGCGSLSKVHLWDVAGSWPIFEKAGLKLRSLQTGEVLDRVDVSIFEHGAAPWKLKNYYILSSERNYSVLRSKIVPQSCSEEGIL